MLLANFTTIFDHLVQIGSGLIGFSGHHVYPRSENS